MAADDVVKAFADESETTLQGRLLTVELLLTAILRENRRGRVYVEQTASLLDDIEERLLASDLERSQVLETIASAREKLRFFARTVPTPDEQ